MQLPAALRKAVERELATANPARLRAASARLSEFYRSGSEGARAVPAPTHALGSDELRAAYLAVRMPATFAAVVAALTWTREACPDEIHSALDLGSGPGTALWAALQVFPMLRAATAIERDLRMIEIARRLACAPAAGSAMLPDPAPAAGTQWLQGDLTAALPQGSWDLVVCAYALNEVDPAQRAEVISRAWARTGKLLVVVEPGTMAGFANVLDVRTRLLASGAILAAPCPNALGCPMSGGGDWCHFAARVERTADHRRLKDATLGHEDEKFSYVAFMRSADARSAFTHGASPDDGESNCGHPARIVRHPRIFSGYTQLTLCRDGEIANTTVTRSKKEDWRRLKRLGWGDRW